MSDVANITIIYTGGTISMTKQTPQGGAMPTLTGADISDQVPNMGQHFNLTHVDLGRLPSPHIDMERILKLRDWIERAFLEGADGVVVTHGTDTLEESAFLCDLTIRTSEPVVFAGALRTIDELSWDGPINLFSACLVAASPDARGKGTMVVMNNTVLAASEVTKSFTASVDTFMSPDFGPIGSVVDEIVVMYREPVRRMRIPNGEGFSRVDIIPCYPGVDTSVLLAAVDAGAKGLVVQAFGRGNVPPVIAAELPTVIDRGVPVVIASRCWGGRVAPIYGYEGGGRRLLEMGCLFAPWYNAQKARLALGLAISAGATRENLIDLFDSPELAEPLPTERVPEKD